MRIVFLKKVFAGFTLAELIVVITVLAILATVGFVALSWYSQDAKSSAIKANVRSVYSAIMAESTSAGTSPRWYVEHATGASLSGALVITDGNPMTLTWGEYGLPPSDSNYSAGNPRWDRLRMNGEKFKISSLSEFFASLASAAYSSSAISVGAVDSRYVSSGKPRSSSFIQVAAISPTTGEAVVTGNYSSAWTGAVAGLLKDPESESATGALTDGLISWTTPAAAPVSCPAGQSLVSGTCTANVWVASAWSACSATCWTGTQTRTVTCRTSDWTALPDSSCLTAKSSTSQSCNTGTTGYYCPSGYGWSGLSLDCYSLVSGAVANHMCCKAGSATVTCVSGGAQVSWCTAVSAPSYGCH